MLSTSQQPAISPNQSVRHQSYAPSAFNANTATTTKRSDVRAGVPETLSASENLCCVDLAGYKIVQTVGT